MIYVDRSSVPNPLNVSLLQDATQRLNEFFQSPSSNRSQRNPPFEMSLVRSSVVDDSLRQLFKGKCAYCETRLDAGMADLGHFRPRTRAAQTDGNVDIEHYWWLVYSWSNLYYVCQQCNSHKATRFPTKRKRAFAGANGDALLEEEALLVDPCSPFVERHFSYETTGEIVGVTEQGRATIAILALNRPPLLQARARTAHRVQMLCSDLVKVASVAARQAFAPLQAMIAPDGEFSGMARVLTSRFMDDDESVYHSASPPRPPVASEQAPAVYHETAVWPARIEISNFRAIASLDLSFHTIGETDDREDSTSRRQPWLVILGENGVGKSSLLRAIALALMPEAQRSELIPDASQLLPRGGHERRGFIRIHFVDRVASFELHFQKNQSHFTTAGSVPPVAVLGYGSTRLLPPRDAIDQRSQVSVRNLFDHHIALANAERFLAAPDEVNKKNFDLLAMNLKELLSLGKTDRIGRRSGALTAKVHNKTVALRELSDGYQSVMALAMDIMFHLSSRTFDMDAVEGLVLLDEIELHLHPRWKIQIVGLLRKVFPRVRFIVSTHDPLCLHGLDKGELFGMFKDPVTHQTHAMALDAPAPGTRTDQILTGAWFGISSTLDRATLDLMEEHSRLLLVRERDRAQNRRVDEVEATLRARLGSYADTPAQRAALTAAAQVEREGLPSDPAELQRQVQKNMRAILAAARNSEK